MDNIVEIQVGIPYISTRLATSRVMLANLSEGMSWASCRLDGVNEISKGPVGISNAVDNRTVVILNLLKEKNGRVLEECNDLCGKLLLICGSRAKFLDVVIGDRQSMAAIRLD